VRESRMVKVFPEEQISSVRGQLLALSFWLLALKL
jgi:hypothetical protein